MALAAIASACGAGAGVGAGDSGAGNGSTAEATAAPSPLSGEFATLGGASIDLGDLEGQDVVLWFWAPW